jgi:choline monooxygenase
MFEPELINPEISKAYTLPGTFYSSAEIFESLKGKVFPHTWQCIAHDSQIESDHNLFPFIFFGGTLDEPLLLSRNGDTTVQIMSNVCTHRGNILVGHPCRSNEIRCGYHGRRFYCDGRFKFMPESRGSENFPSPKDDLPLLEYGFWKGFHFTVISDPIMPFHSLIHEMNARVGWMPIEDFRYDSTRANTYTIKANWALYCDNYLEGFHIPFVHPELNQSLDYHQYETLPGQWSVLQIGIAKAGEPSFELPQNSPDFGKQVAAYYFWLFPNIMLNFYPWGLSLNLVYPLTNFSTRVEFHSYIWKPELLETGAGGNLDTVELQDEKIVENVQRGVRSRLYKRGRFAPFIEQGVHRFHQLLAMTLS